MIVLDIETSGTDPHKHSIVSIGAVEFENPSNQFYEECRIWDGAHVMDEALTVNGFTRIEIVDPSKKSDNEIVQAFLTWAIICNNHTIAGQNPSFDRDFIRHAALRYGIDCSLAHRTIDLHSICYFHMVRRNIVPPAKKGRTDLDSDKIMNYVGIPAEPKPHKAINGAIWETEALYRLFYDKSIFPEFSQHRVPWVSNPIS